MWVRSEPPPSEFGNDLVWLSVLVQRRYSRICTEHDLTPAQATLLCVIRDQSHGMGELAEILGMTKNAVSGLVDRIERRGLARRETPAHDRRAVILSTTSSGKAAVDALYADVAECLPRIATSLSSVEKRQFAEAVARVVADSQVTAMPADAGEFSAGTGQHFVG